MGFIQTQCSPEFIEKSRYDVRLNYLCAHKDCCHDPSILIVFALGRDKLYAENENSYIELRRDSKHVTSVSQIMVVVDKPLA